MGRGGSAAQRVPKGKKMAGQYGHECVTIQNQHIINIDNSKKLILISGAIPGPAGSIVIIKSSVKKPNFKKEFNIITKSKQKEIETNNEAIANDKEALHAAAVKQKKEESKK
jgi:large subunit ribosomal protein L3